MFTAAVYFYPGNAFVVAVLLSLAEIGLAWLVNGLLHIQSAPGKGARVQVFIPLTEEAADRLHHAAGIG